MPNPNALTFLQLKCSSNIKIDMKNIKICTNPIYYRFPSFPYIGVYKYSDPVLSTFDLSDLSWLSFIKQKSNMNCRPLSFASKHKQKFSN